VSLNIANNTDEVNIDLYGQINISKNSKDIYLAVEGSAFESQRFTVGLDNIDGEISKVLIIELLVFFFLTSLDSLTFFFFVFFTELRGSGLESNLDGDVTNLLGQFDGVFFSDVSQSETILVQEFLK